MCGIAGFINNNGSNADTILLEQMLAKLFHRGPDHQKSWALNNIAMGYTRLKIMDLTERGNQPFISEDQKGVLFYNGEIYNFRELRSDLEKKGIQFKSRSDTEVVLNSLKIYGPEKAIRFFNGMFAFAYYDLVKKELWIGRDRAGIKPIYWIKSNGITAFASEIKALFGHPNIPCRPDLHAVTSFIMDQRLNRITPFEGVQEVRPGSLVKFSAEKIEEIIYFDFLRDLDIDRIVNGSDVDDETWLKQLDSIFSKSVESHMQSDAPLAFMTSGGVDSSLITAIAKDYKPNSIQAYVADVKGEEENEVERAKFACEHIGVNLKTVSIDLADYVRLWPKSIYHFDEPLFFRQGVLHMAVAERVKKDGYKVLLCGEGADEVFGGYQWQEMPYRAWLLRDKRKKYIKYLTPFRHLLKKFVYADSLFMYDHFLANPLFDPFKSAFIKKRHITAIGGGITDIRQKELFQKLSEKLSNADSAFITQSFTDFELHLGTSLKMNDKMNMAHSIESRVPFLDNRIIDFGFHLPVKLKLDKTVSKSILKKTASKKLPKSLVYQKKIGFHVSNRMSEYSTDLLNGGITEHWFKWRADVKNSILELIQSNQHLKYHLMSTELWARIYFDNESPDQLSEMLFK